MPGLLENKMLLYYLSTLGQGLMDEDNPMQGVADVTKQAIAAEGKHKLSMEYMNMIKEMLAGGGKLSMDKDKFKLDAPSALLGDVSGLLKEQQVPFKGAPSGTSMNVPGGQLETQQDLLRQSYLNPSASPLDITGADLVGLTPADVTQALQTGLGYGGLEQRRLSDLRKMMQPKPVDPRDQPFIGGYTLRQFNAFTPDYKEYVLAKEGAKTLGDDAFMTKREWEEIEPTEREKFLKGLEDRPELLETERKLAEARAIAPRPSKPAPMNISTATRELTKRFGRLDPTGMWAVTPELQATHRKAQDLLVDFKDAEMDLPRAVNKAETQARKWKDTIEDSYHARIVAAQQIGDKSERERMINHIKSEFYRQFKYIPSSKRTP